MRIYTVHIDPFSAAADRDAVLVKEGFSWPAALFGMIWALWHRMWWTAAGLGAAWAALSGVLYVIPMAPALALAVEIAVALIVGHAGNDLRRLSLKARGFVETGVVAAVNREAAEQRHFDRQAGPAGEPSALRPGPRSPQLV